jgi:hypothetical protein
VADEVSTGELARQLERMESRRLVGEDLYLRDQREIERRFGEVERDLADERKAREEADKELKELHRQRNAQRGTDWRQALYSGLIPAAIVLVGILYQALGGG